MKARADKLVADAKALAKLVPEHPTMAPIPSGTVKLGETGKTFDLAALFMDRTEVTVAAYAACVASGKCTPAETGDGCNAGVAGRENHPINCVDWSQADAYCQAQGLRLPTEEEWRCAATGGDGRTYPWGRDKPGSQLCWDGEGNDQGKGNRTSTCAVGAYPEGRSPFGLDDMAGNVWEWTSTQEGSDRVNRGGGWYVDHPSDVDYGSHRRNDPTLRSDDLGFRCAGSAALP